MGIFSIILLSLALAADAFAVSLCKGLGVREVKIRHCVIVALYFGGFQAIMPVCGYFLGSAMEQFIAEIDHFIAFILLSIIGGKMIKDSFGKQVCAESSGDFSAKIMFPLSVATSIDALVVGVSLAIEKSNILLCACVIGAVTALTSIVALNIGNKCGLLFGNKASLFGGIILIILGAKILVEHLFLQ